MNNKQEINRIRKKLSKHLCRECGCLECEFYRSAEQVDGCCREYIGTISKTCAKVGIGDKKQAVKEAFEKLKDEAVYFAGGEYVEVRDINKLFTELYGEEL